MGWGNRTPFPLNLEGHTDFFFFNKVIEGAEVEWTVSYHPYGCERGLKIPPRCGSMNQDEQPGSNVSKKLIDSPAMDVSLDCSKEVRVKEGIGIPWRKNSHFC